MVSIIIPFWNTKKYIYECLSSIKVQAFSDFEVLMIDDGSTDESRAIAERFSAADSRFKLLGGSHIGFPRAKNLGLDEAHGEYICFVDSDDYVAPDYLRLLKDGLEVTDADICCCNHYSFADDKPHPIFKSLPVYGKDPSIFREKDKINFMLTTWGSTFMWNKMYRRSIFDNFRFADVMALSDTMLCYKLFDSATLVAGIPEHLIAHRSHLENMTFRMLNGQPGYPEHRLNVYIDMCSFLFEKYPRFKKNLECFYREWARFCRKVNNDLISKYSIDERVKTLLEAYKLTFESNP